jgi:hypothetical protein
MKIRWDSPATAAAVLEAIRRDLREWRESVIPATLRSQGVFQVQGRVRGDRFELWYASFSEDRPYVLLRGTVVDRPDGGCELTAALGHNTIVFALPVALALVGIWEVARAGTFSTLVLAGVATAACFAYTRTVSHRHVRDATYLVERLRQAVDRATHGEPVAPAS